MKKIYSALLHLLMILCLTSKISFGQIIYGVTRDAASQELYLSQINQSTGQVTNISSTPFSSQFSLGGLSTIDPYHKIFYLQSNYLLFGIDLNNGNVSISDSITTPFPAYFDLMRYDFIDSTLYGIARNSATQELYLAKIDPATGEVSVISASSFASSYFLNALATIDPFEKIFYLQSNYILYGIDLTSGNVVYSDSVTAPFPVYFDLMTFDCADSTIYGAARNTSTQELSLSKINPATGEVTIISAAPFTQGYAGDALSAIDPTNNLFYLVSNSALYAIDLTTGNVVSNPTVTTPITGYFNVMSISPACDIALGISHVETQGNFVISPNPSSGTIEFKNLPSPSNLRIQILDASGSILLEKRISSPEISLPSSFVNGFYLLKIFNDENNFSVQRFILSR